MRAKAIGMRFLAQRRDRIERKRNRLLSAAHVRREHNTEADKLANLDASAFREQILDRIPGAFF